MIELSLDATEGEWFRFFGSHIDPNTGETVFEDPVSDARVQIRGIAPFIEERIANRKKTVEHVLNPKTRNMERISYYADLTPDQERQEREDVWDYAIVSFENFRDKKTGTEIECTRENKLKLMKVPVFDRFVGRCLQLLTDSQTKAREEEAKNL
jgi:hypothetical protein